jgi:hypothetical protein
MCRRNPTLAGRREMRRCLVMVVGTVITLALVAAPAVADDSTDSIRAAAVAVCKARPKARNVTVAIKVDGETTNHRYACSRIWSTAPAGSKVPAVTDFKVGIDVLKKQCFASAGCSIAYKINVRYNGSTPLDPSKTYTVVDDVAGAESPITANFTIDGTKVNSHNGTAYTPNKDATLTATATSVLEGG